MKNRQTHPLKKRQRLFTFGGVFVLIVMLLAAFGTNRPVDTNSVLHLLTQRMQKAFAANPTTLKKALATHSDTPPAVMLSNEHPRTPEPNPGATFDTKTVSFAYTEGEKVVLAGSGDGKGKIFVDDILSLTVIQPNQNLSGPREIRFTPPCETTRVSVRGKQPIDITSMFAPGKNTVIAVFKDGCSAGTTAPNHTSSTAFWLVPIVSSFWSPATIRLGLNCAFNAAIMTLAGTAVGFGAALLVPATLGWLAATAYSVNLLEAAIILAEIQGALTPAGLLSIVAGLVPVAAVTLINACIGGQMPFFERHWACQIAPDDAQGNCADEPKSNIRSVVSSVHPSDTTPFDALATLETGAQTVQSWMANPNLLCHQVPGTTTDTKTGLCVTSTGAYYTNAGQLLGASPCAAIAGTTLNANTGFYCLTPGNTAYDFNGFHVGTCALGVPDRVGDCVNADGNIYNPQGQVTGQVNPAATTDLTMQYILGRFTDPNYALA